MATTAAANSIIMVCVVFIALVFILAPGIAARSLDQAAEKDARMSYVAGSLRAGSDVPGSGPSRGDNHVHSSGPSGGDGHGHAVVGSLKGNVPGSGPSLGGNRVPAVDSSLKSNVPAGSGASPIGNRAPAIAGSLKGKGPAGSKASPIGNRVPTGAGSLKGSYTNSWSDPVHNLDHVAGSFKAKTDYYSVPSPGSNH